MDFLENGNRSSLEIESYNFLEIHDPESESKHIEVSMVLLVCLSWSNSETGSGLQHLKTRPVLILW